MNVEILQVKEKDRIVVENLARLYTYDISEFARAVSDGYKCSEEGLFEGGCGGYFESLTCQIFLVRVDNELAGFAIIELLDQGCSIDYTVSEFFILRAFRGKGIGKYVAHALFNRFKGNWDVMVWIGNSPAVAFWGNVIEDYTSGNWSSTRETPQRYSGWEMIVHRFNDCEA